MKLTNEEIARVFAMYLGAPVIAVSHQIKNSMEHIDWGLSLEDEGYEMIFGKNTFNLQNRRLLLTPLSKISDEHLLELCKNRGASNYTLTEHKERSINNMKNIIRDEGFFIIEYQQLVLWGSAVPLFFGLNHPANGFTAIDLNIAKDKTL